MGIPKLCEQECKGDQAIAYLKFYKKTAIWYITELDEDLGLMYGLVIHSKVELGYFQISEVKKRGVKKDDNFSPTTISELRKFHKRMHHISFLRQHY